MAKNKIETDFKILGAPAVKHENVSEIAYHARDGGLVLVIL